jgi:RNA polymerase sigma-70 factor (ECF subfamily)
VALTDLDRNLLKQCLSQHPGAWQDFVDRFIGLFVHVVRHTAHVRSVPVDDADVEDLCSEVFLTLLADDFAVLRAFRGDCSLATYLTVIARRVVVREITKRRRAQALGHVDAHHSTLNAADADSPMARIENREEVAAMLEGLPDREATIIRQFHLDGKTYREISSELGVPENTIGPTLSRARDRLKKTQLRAGV